MDLSSVHFLYICMCIRAVLVCVFVSACTTVSFFPSHPCTKAFFTQSAADDAQSAVHAPLHSLGAMVFFLSLLPTPCSKDKLAILAGNIHCIQRCFGSESELASSLRERYKDFVQKSQGVCEAFICSSLKQGRRGLPHGSCWWRSCRS